MGKIRKLALDKGRELEEKIEKYFQLQGYQTEKNSILEGKSGGNHEIDILAEKSDGITTIRIMVECKAWNKPIEKDVVSKVNYILQDLGLNKAIIVTLKGWRIGAEKTAKQLGIELWGTDEIEKRLGRVAIAELETIEFRKTIIGFPVLIKEGKISPLIEKERKGFLGFGKEEIKWTKLLWIPCYLFEIGHTKPEGLIKRKVKTRKIWNLYEALEGFWFLTFENEPELKEVKVKGILQPRIKDRKIKNTLIKTFEKAREVVTPRARARYASRLRELGVSLPVANISVDNIVETYYPFYLALLEKGKKGRIIAVDGVDGDINHIISSVLTQNLSYVLETIKVNR